MVQFNGRHRIESRVADLGNWAVRFNLFHGVAASALPQCTITIFEHPIMSASLSKKPAATASKCVPVAAAVIKVAVPTSYEKQRAKAYDMADAHMVQQVLSWCSRMENGQLIPGHCYLADTVLVRMRVDLSFDAFRSEGDIVNDNFQVKVSDKTFHFKKSELLNNRNVQDKITAKLQELCPDAGFVGVSARPPTKKCKHWRYWIKVALQ
jgi:hypothetical protein